GRVPAPPAREVPGGVGGAGEPGERADVDRHRCGRVPADGAADRRARRTAHRHVRGRGRARRARRPHRPDPVRLARRHVHPAGRRGACEDGRSRLRGPHRARRAAEERAVNGRLQRGIIIVPNALTLANLFFGVWAIVSASRGDFITAAWLVVIASVADLLDGRVARVTRTGSRFGAELDSLVDAISFGVAPSLIDYHLFLADGTWSWIASLFYATSAVIRLARFNTEPGGQANDALHGPPSAAAGPTLATLYPLSQTEFFQPYPPGWPWPVLMTALMVILRMLMMRHGRYPVVPKFGFRTARGRATLVGLVL